jgi:hypothetical protein
LKAADGGAGGGGDHDGLGHMVLQVSPVHAAADLATQ